MLPFCMYPELTPLRPNLFAFGLLLVGIGYLVTLNVMNVDYYIAERNIDRYENGEELDTRYLRGLSVDAMPVIFEFLYATTDDDICYSLGNWLRSKFWYSEHRYEVSSIFEFNLAHQAARELFEPSDFDVAITDCSDLVGVP